MKKVITTTSAPLPSLIRHPDNLLPLAHLEPNSIPQQNVIQIQKPQMIIEPVLRQNEPQNQILPQINSQNSIQNGIQNSIQNNIQNNIQNEAPSQIPISSFKPPPNPSLFFHNKMPKCGSTTMQKLLKILEKQNNFKLHNIYVAGSMNQDNVVFDELDKDSTRPAMILKHHTGCLEQSYPEVFIYFSMKMNSEFHEIFTVDSFSLLNYDVKIWNFYVHYSGSYTRWKLFLIC